MVIGTYIYIHRPPGGGNAEINMKVHDRLVKQKSARLVNRAGFSLFDDLCGMWYIRLAKPYSTRHQLRRVLMTSPSEHIGLIVS
jgi:hypothetical protein